MKRALLIVAIVVAVIIVVLIIIFATKGRQMMNLALFNTMESMMLQNRPDSVSEDSIRTVIGTAIARINSGEIDDQQMQSLILRFRDCLADNRMDSLEVITMLEEMNGL